MNDVCVLLVLFRWLCLWIDDVFVVLFLFRQLCFLQMNNLFVHSVLFSGFIRGWTMYLFFLYSLDCYACGWTMYLFILYLVRCLCLWMNDWAGRCSGHQYENDSALPFPGYTYTYAYSSSYSINIQQCTPNGTIWDNSCLAIDPDI